MHNIQYSILSLLSVEGKKVYECTFITCTSSSFFKLATLLVDDTTRLYRYVTKYKLDTIKKHEVKY